MPTSSRSSHFQYFENQKVKVFSIRVKIMKVLSFLGIIAALVSWLFILTSILFNQWWISRFTTGALSELGTPNQGVNYPWIYNDGLIITSIIAIVYSCYLVYISGNKLQVVGSSFFIIASFFLMLIGIYHGGTYPHVFVSTYFFVQADVSIVVWAIGLIYSKRNLGYYMLILGILGPILAKLLPLTSSAEVEVLGIFVIDIWVFMIYLHDYKLRKK